MAHTPQPYRLLFGILRIFLFSVCLNGIFSSRMVVRAEGEECGKQNGGKTCPLNVCCSEWGFCGTLPVSAEKEKERRVLWSG